MAYKGKFNPKNPNKYNGDASKIQYRSSWELKLMMRFDNHPDVIWWNSEEVVIPYISPIDNKYHRYFVDFLVKIKNKDGLYETLLIEVKPKSQTSPPTKSKNVNKKYIKEVFTWGVNEAKWKAAEKYCKEHGWKFEIFTEEHLGIK
jgi:hypothetical protein